MNGGDRVAAVLERHGVRFLFTLCGGHISPILVGAKRRGIRVIDVRHEATAVFAADAVARLSGVPGVAAVTAGPGATNAITAVKNAQLAQSPVVVLGGAAPTALQGRGALQDIDHLALLRPHVKWAASVRRIRELAPILERAFAVAAAGAPGPVFVECPVDLLYDEALVRSWYAAKGAAGRRSLADRLRAWYLDRHVGRLFAGVSEEPTLPAPPTPREPTPGAVARATRLITGCERPVLLIGSGAMLRPDAATELARAVRELGVPVYLSGMARGLLGPRDPLLLRHARGRALREADLVVLAGVPCDFRLDYGRQIARAATVVAAGRDRAELVRNRRPSLAVVADASRFLMALGSQVAGRPPSGKWLARLRERDDEREEEIARLAGEPTEGINPLALCRDVDRALDADSVVVADGGDFVGTASYTVSPRGPLSWLDPGPFGTLGVGAGLALGAKLTRPEAEVWVLYGDGAAAFSLAEFDTFARHGLGIIAVVGNDAAWSQIARGQVEMLGDDVATVLRPTDYHRVAEGYGGAGYRVDRTEDVARALAHAKARAQAGCAVLVNAMIGKTDFRSGSISM